MVGCGCFSSACGLLCPLDSHVDSHVGSTQCTKWASVEPVDDLARPIIALMALTVGGKVQSERRWPIWRRRAIACLDDTASGFAAWLRAALPEEASSPQMVQVSKRQPGWWKPPSGVRHPEQCSVGKNVRGSLSRR